ncbi:3-methyl-2-oxobutanoate hydroxymethyltransferase [Planctomycetales bacterium 10988]|nr:3-methyl-2-oxobutanoate hydroxymethyltransferase [Planctomycetales bacterium 10988]
MLTVPQFLAKKQTGAKLTMLTAYDYLTASILDETEVDAILVGDTLGMVIQGKSTTLPVSLDEIIYHAEMVVRATKKSLVVVDLPFPGAHLGPKRTLEAAARILKETGAPAIKIEGGAEIAETIACLTNAGIPVMAHCGLQPQSVHQTGGYRVAKDHTRILEDAEVLEDAGAFCVLLECVPAELAADVTQALLVPTLGIGAGPYCDGQVLVTHDLLGLTSEPHPKFVKKYIDLKEAAQGAISQFCQDVQTKRFPSEKHSYH